MQGDYRERKQPPPPARLATTVNDCPPILCELHDQYAEQVNLAVSEGRYDIVQALSNEFTTVSLTARIDATTRQQHAATSVGHAQTN